MTILLLLLAAPVYLLLRPGPAFVPPDASSVLNNSWQASVEQYAASRFPVPRIFGQMRLSLLLASGQSEQNNVFISEKGLMKRIGPVKQEVVDANIASITALSDRLKALDTPVPVFVALLPTSSAILQENLPLFSNTINQRLFIDEVYGGLLGHAATINVYNHLLSYRSHYIYYRTADNFTSLGGYHVFSRMMPRLLNTEAPPLSAYHLTYPKHDYIGELYDISPYRSVTPDVITLFRFTQFSREYIVTHTSLEERKTYHTLYPEHLLRLGHDTEVFMGGLSSVTDILTTAPYQNRSLLIFGDKTALAYAPFLANHYRRITIVDLFHPDAVTSGLHAANYSQVMFAYSTDTFMSSEFPAEILNRLSSLS